MTTSTRLPRHCGVGVWTDPVVPRSARQCRGTVGPPWLPENECFLRRGRMVWRPAASVKKRTLTAEWQAPFATTLAKYHEDVQVQVNVIEGEADHLFTAGPGVQ
jgi:hypothetical protein